MRVRTDGTIDALGVGTWAVVAEWFGAERVVHTGSLFECLAFAAGGDA